MKEAFRKLKSKSIIDSQKVEVIRRYIKSRFPDAPQKQQGAIFADAVHKLIDGNISQFEEKHRKSIKDQVFRKAALRPSFFINADEIFTSALNIKDGGKEYLDSLMSWVSVNQDQPVTREELGSLVEKLKDMSVDELEARLEEVITVVDDQEKIERRIREISLSMGLGELKETGSLEDMEKSFFEKPEAGKKPAKSLFVKEVEEKKSDWNLDQQIQKALHEPKPVEELSVMGKKPVEVPKEKAPYRDSSFGGTRKTEAEMQEAEGFSRKDADRFFKVIRENSDKRRKRLTPPKGMNLGDKLGKMFQSIAPAKKAKLHDVLLQVILMLVMIVGIGIFFAVQEQGKTYIPVSDAVLKNGSSIDIYKEIYDLYLTPKSKNQR